MCVYLRTKFQVSCTILTSFRQGLILPSKYSLERCLSISEEQLQQAGKLSGVLRILNEYLENDFMNRCAEMVEQPGDFVNVYLSIKQGLASPLEKVNAICGFYFSFLVISKPNAEIFSGFFTA